MRGALCVKHGFFAQSSRTSSNLYQLCDSTVCCEFSILAPSIVKIGRVGKCCACKRGCWALVVILVHAQSGWKMSSGLLSAWAPVPKIAPYMLIHCQTLSATPLAVFFILLPRPSPNPRIECGYCAGGDYGTEERALTARPHRFNSPRESCRRDESGAPTLLEHQAKNKPGSRFPGC